MIPVNTPLLEGNEKKYLNECIDTGWISSEGPFVEKFEKNFAEKTGRKFGIAVCNGSVALDCAVLALNFEKGSEIIMPTFTIISCAASIIRAGCLPVLVDCEADTFNLNTDHIEEKITPRTKAIMVVHVYGLPVDMNPVFALAEKYGLKIIEDAAEQHGQYYYNTPIGKLGHISTFSFYPNKHITTGEGGMIFTDDEHLAEKCRSLRNLCFVQEKRFIHYELGFNYRMSNIQAALGVAQLEQLEKFVAKKREIGARYSEGLQLVEGVQLPTPKKPFAHNIYWVYSIVLGDEIPFNAEQAMKKLAALGVGTRPFFYPMHLQPVFKTMGLFSNETYPVADRIAEKGFYLPSGLGLTEAEQQEVMDKLKVFLETLKKFVMVFDAYAAYYDLLYKDKNYNEEAVYVNQLIKKHIKGARTVLDLGCGTGKHAAEFASLGYKVDGVDLSEKMIKIAETNCIRPGIAFHLGDIRNIRLGKKFDVVVALFHVLCYQTEDKDLLEALETASVHLNKTGIFIFDCWYGPAVLNDPPEVRTKRMCNEKIEVERLATPFMQRDKKIVNVDYEVRIKDKEDKHQYLINENHQMRYLFKEDIEALSKLKGFEIIGIHEWLQFEELLSTDCWNVTFVLRPASSN